MAKHVSTDKLLPCPWCGEEPALMKRERMDGRETFFRYYVQCTYYGCLLHPQTGFWKYPNEAVYSWNDRQEGTNGT